MKRTGREVGVRAERLGKVWIKKPGQTDGSEMVHLALPAKEKQEEAERATSRTELMRWESKKECSDPMLEKKSREGHWLNFV